MTVQESITFKQKKQFRRLFEDFAEFLINDSDVNKVGLQQLLEHGGEFKNAVAKLFNEYTNMESSFTNAHNIFCEDFIGPNEIMEKFDIVYDDERKKLLKGTVPSSLILQKYRRREYVLIPGPPKSLSVCEVCALKNDFIFELKSFVSDHKNTRFIKDVVEPGWICFPKHILLDSLGKPMSEQLAYIPKKTDIRNVAVVLWSLLVYYTVRGRMLLGNYKIRTASTDTDGDHICVIPLIDSVRITADIYDSTAEEKLGIVCYADDVH